MFVLEYRDPALLRGDHRDSLKDLLKTHRFFKYLSLTYTSSFRSSYTHKITHSLPLFGLCLTEILHMISPDVLPDVRSHHCPPDVRYLPGNPVHLNRTKLPDFRSPYRKSGSILYRAKLSVVRSSSGRPVLPVPPDVARMRPEIRCVPYRANSSDFWYLPEIRCHLSRAVLSDFRYSPDVRCLPRHRMSGQYQTSDKAPLRWLEFLHYTYPSARNYHRMSGDSTGRPVLVLPPDVRHVRHFPA